MDFFSSFFVIRLFSSFFVIFIVLFLVNSITFLAFLFSSSVFLHLKYSFLYFFIFADVLFYKMFSFIFNCVIMLLAPISLFNIIFLNFHLLRLQTFCCLFLFSNFLYVGFNYLLRCALRFSRFYSLFLFLFIFFVSLLIAHLLVSNCFGVPFLFYNLAF